MIMSVLLNVLGLTPPLSEVKSAAVQGLTMLQTRSQYYGNYAGPAVLQCSLRPPGPGNLTHIALNSNKETFPKLPRQLLSNSQCSVQVQAE